MSTVTLKKISNAFDKFVERVESIDGFRQTFYHDVIYPIYQKAQVQRWDTEGESEGEGWDSISSTWIDRKKKLQAKNNAAYPGGDKIMVFTSDLFKSLTVIGEKWSRVLITPDAITVSSGAPYAKYANDARTFSVWGDATKKDIKDAVKDFVNNMIKKGVING